MKYAAFPFFMFLTAFIYAATVDFPLLGFYSFMGIIFTFLSVVFVGFLRN